MLEVLKFIFSDFRIWLGTLMMIYAFGGGFSGVIQKNYKVYKNARRNTKV
jgi:hypothetical protein